MPSTSIYTFSDTNTALTNFFNIEYTHMESSEESLYEHEKTNLHGFDFFSQSRRDSLIEDVSILIDQLRSKNRDTALHLVKPYTVELNRQINYLLNKCQKKHDPELIEEVRKLRASKRRLFRFS